MSIDFTSIVTASGDPDRITEMLNFVSSAESTFDFNNIVTMPKVLIGQLEEAKADHSPPINRLQYRSVDAWRHLHWGTCSDAVIESVKSEFDQDKQLQIATIVLHTERSYPNILVLTLSTFFPDLEFRFEIVEENHDWRRVIVCKSGNVEFDECTRLYDQSVNENIN